MKIKEDYPGQQSELALSKSQEFRTLNKPSPPTSLKPQKYQTIYSSAFHLLQKKLKVSEYEDKRSTRAKQKNVLKQKTKLNRNRSTSKEQSMMRLSSSGKFTKQLILHQEKKGKLQRENPQQIKKIIQTLNQKSLTEFLSLKSRQQQVKVSPSKKLKVIFQPKKNSLPFNIFQKINDFSNELIKDEHQKISPSLLPFISKKNLTEKKQYHQPDKPPIEPGLLKFRHSSSSNFSKKPKTRPHQLNIINRQRDPVEVYQQIKGWHDIRERQIDNENIDGLEIQSFMNNDKQLGETQFNDFDM